MSITTRLVTGVRPHPGGSGFQVRVRGFRARTFATAELANEHAIELHRRRRQGVRVEPARIELTLATLAHFAGAWLELLATAGGKQGRPYSEASMVTTRRAARPWTGDGQTIPAALDSNGVAFASLPLAALDPAEVDIYLAKRAARGRRAAAGEWQALRGILELAQRRGEQFDPRLLHLTVRRRTPDERIPLDWHQLRYLADHAPEYIRRLFLLGGTLGCRIGELLAADEAWLDLKAHTFTIPAWACKERRTKVIHLLDEEMALFREQLLARGRPSTLLFPRREGAPWNHANFWHKVLAPTRRKAAKAWREEHRLAEDARTPFEWPMVDEHGRPVLNAKGKQRSEGFAPHDLRRGATDLLLELDVPAELIAARLGHKDGGYLLLKRYARERQDRLVAELARIDAAGGIAAALGGAR